MIQFEEFKKIPRLFRDCTISEKIDGTNGQIVIQPSMLGAEKDNAPITRLTVSDVEYFVWAGSRNRWIQPGKATDNCGFAAWVYENAISLIEILGEGRHYGEWWGAGIQRRYGLTEKRFSLFNPRWTQALQLRALANQPVPAGLGVVPVLYEGLFSTAEVKHCLDHLRVEGSHAAPGFMDPEGVVVYHHAAKTYAKATIKNDEKPKGSTE